MTTKVLLLNNSYQPIQVVSYKRAVNLILAEKAYPVEGIAKVLRTVTRTFEVPAVIALNYYVSAPRRNYYWTKTRVLQRDKYTCIYCGDGLGDKQKGHVLTKKDFTLDHIVPKSRGGANSWGNTACSCYNCNQRKGNRTPNEAGMKLLWEPKRPRTKTFVVEGNVPQNWKRYLQY